MQSLINYNIARASLTQLQYSTCSLYSIEIINPNFKTARELVVSVIELHFYPNVCLLHFRDKVVVEVHWRRFAVFGTQTSSLVLVYAGYARGKKRTDLRRSLKMDGSISHSLVFFCSAGLLH